MDFTWYGKKIIESKDSHQSKDTHEKSSSTIRHSRRMSLNQTPSFKGKLLESEQNSEKHAINSDLKTPLSSRNSTQNNYKSSERYQDQIQSITKDYPKFSVQTATDYLLTMNKSKLPYLHNQVIARQSFQIPKSHKETPTTNLERTSLKNFGGLDNPINKSFLDREANIQNDMFNLQYNKIASTKSQNNPKESSDYELRNLLINQPDKHIKEKLELKSGENKNINEFQNKIRISSNIQTPRQRRSSRVEQVEENIINPLITQDQLQHQDTIKRQNLSLLVLNNNNQNIEQVYISQNITDQKKFDMSSKYNQKTTYRKKVDINDSFESSSNKNNKLVQSQQQDDFLQQLPSSKRSAKKTQKRQDEIIEDIFYDLKINQSSSSQQQNQSNTSQQQSYSKERDNIQPSNEKQNHNQNKDLNKFIARIQKQLGDYNYTEAIQKFYQFEKKYQEDRISASYLSQEQVSISTASNKNTLKDSSHISQNSSNTQQPNNTRNTQTNNDSNNNQNIKATKTERKSVKLKESSMNDHDLSQDEQFQQSSYMSSKSQKPQKTLKTMQTKDEEQIKHSKSIRTQKSSIKDQEKQLVLSNDQQRQTQDEYIQTFQQIVEKQDQSIQTTEQFFETGRQPQRYSRSNQKSPKNNMKQYGTVEKEQMTSRNSQNQLSPEKLNLLSIPRYLSERADQKKFKYQFCGRNKCFSPDKSDQNIYNEYQDLIKAQYQEKSTD